MTEPAPRIDSQAYQYWGKARPRDTGPAFHLLPYHCLDVAAAGCEYLRRAPAFRDFLMHALRIETEAVLQNWIAFWLALHDLGKFSEAFQSQRPDLFLALRGRKPNAAKQYSVRHDSLGMLFWKEVLLDRALDEEWFGPQTELLEDGLNWWMRAVTGHHGQPPAEGGHWDHYFDRQQDQAAIVGFVEELRALLIDDAIIWLPLASGPTRFLESSKELSWWVAGLAVLADWIGSNEEFFHYRADFDSPLPLAQYWKHARERAAAAIDATGVLPVEVDREIGFAELFPAIVSPSPLQDWAASVEIPPGPQIYLLEDVTGAGKTEAAVVLAHRLIATGRADGFFIGLPTMATANAMYGRIAQVYAKLFSGNASLTLAHGQRDLVESFAHSVMLPGPSDDDVQQLDDSATVRCTAWLADHNKRALLAPAGVGTLDQALLAVLISKHQSLRVLGLFRKVLIVDEVHACDAYMQGVLETLLIFHARAGGSAILLSATLAQRMKQALLDAFACGCRSSGPAVRSLQYPLVTAWHPMRAGEPEETRLATREDVRRTLSVRYVCDEAEVIDAVEAALADGKCVCWIRNTVSDALAAYTRFQDRMPADRLILFHARFALCDRLRTENRILELFGKHSTPACRRGRLVIATQVAEQSLDADWDFVVSDLAPIDRLIQRAGRLQRHPRDAQGQRLADPTARDQRGTPCLWVLGPPWTAEPQADWFKAMFPKGAGVYPHHGQLWLTAGLLRKGRIVIPDDARSFIEAVFGDEASVPPGLQANANAAEGQGYSDASIAQQNTVKLTAGYARGAIDWWSEAKTPSRLGESSVNVLLARWERGRLRPWADRPDPRHAWAYSSVRVAERLIERAADPSDPTLGQAIERLLPTLPGKGRWCVLLVLEQTAQGWTGRAWPQARRNDPPTPKTWRYSEESGLVDLD